MNGLLVGVFTAAPVILGIWLGSHRGGGRAFVWLSKLVFAWGSGIGLAAYGLRCGWHSPWGLITPIFLGLLTAVVLRMLLTWRGKRRRNRRKGRASLGFIQRTSGAVLGAAIGFVLAVTGWQIALLASSLTTPPPDATITVHPQPQPAAVVAAATEKTAWASLAELAHRGFIRHLPVAGPLTDELLAVASILKTPQPVRKEFARHKEWDSLAILPSFQDMTLDQALMADIDAAVAGNLAALYRLQRHPYVIEFYNEEPLQAVIAELKAGQIASELIEFEKTYVAEPVP